MNKNSVSLFFSFLLIPLMSFAMPVERVVSISDNKVVMLELVVDNHQEGVCSGVIIDPDGDVLTCAHCLNHKGIVKLFVTTQDGNTREGLLIRVDVKRDLALLAIASTRYNWPYMKLGKEPVKGQEVVLFGSPLGVQGTISVGYIENFLPNSDGITHQILLQSAATNPGNSGGPLVDLSGRLIGIGEGEFMLNSFVPANGLGFAVDLREIRSFLAEQ